MHKTICVTIVLQQGDHVEFNAESDLFDIYKPYHRMATYTFILSENEQNTYVSLLVER